VEEAAFDKPALPSEKGGSAQALSSAGGDWMDNIRKILGIGAAITIFVLFIGMLRKQLADKSGMEVVTEATSEEASRQTAITPEVLNELIQNKPDNVSAALKSWVSAGQNKR